MHVKTQAGLTLLGTIHTHPSYDAYLSSIDMHMQYQMQRDNSVAISIVVDKENQISAFHLTDFGMQVRPFSELYILYIYLV